MENGYAKAIQLTKCYLKLGDLYKETKNFNAALESYQAAYQHAYHKEDKFKPACAIGSLHQKLGNLKIAYRYFTECNLTENIEIV